MKIILITTFFLLTPLFAYASNDIQTFTETLINFLGNGFFIFLLSVGFIIFAINVVRYFVIETDDVSKRANARNQAMYGILAFVFILILLGLVTILVNFFGLGGQNAPIPDYIQKSQQNF